jgi:hypothetical protein
MKEEGRRKKEEGRRFIYVNLEPNSKRATPIEPGYYSTLEINEVQCFILKLLWGSQCVAYFPKARFGGKRRNISCRPVVAP